MRMRTLSSGKSVHFHTVLLPCHPAGAGCTYECHPPMTGEHRQHGIILIMTSIIFPRKHFLLIHAAKNGRDVCRRIETMSCSPVVEWKFHVHRGSLFLSNNSTPRVPSASSVVRHRATTSNLIIIIIAKRLFPKLIEMLTAPCAFLSGRARVQLTGE